MSPTASSFLYRLNGPALAGSCYLFGSMHVRDERAFGARKLVYAAVDACVAFATEFNLHELAHAAEPDAMLLPDGQTLDQLLGARAYGRLRRILDKAFGVQLDRVRHLRPMIITNLITESLMANHYELSLDAHLWEYAEQQGKITLGIERYEDQVTLLRRLSLDIQLKGLVQMGRHPAKFKRQIQRTADQYAAGDLLGIYRSTRHGAGGMRRDLIFRRNAVMSRQIQTLGAEQSLFATVGAAHLPGGKGVLRLLKRAGVQVKPVRSEADII